MLLSDPFLLSFAIPLFLFTSEFILLVVRVLLGVDIDFLLVQIDALFVVLFLLFDLFDFLSHLSQFRFPIFHDFLLSVLQISDTICKNLVCVLKFLVFLLLVFDRLPFSLILFELPLKESQFLLRNVRSLNFRQILISLLFQLKILFEMTDFLLGLGNDVLPITIIIFVLLISLLFPFGLDFLDFLILFIVFFSL